MFPCLCCTCPQRRGKQGWPSWVPSFQQELKLWFSKCFIYDNNLLNEKLLFFSAVFFFFSIQKTTHSKDVYFSYKTSSQIFPQLRSQIVSKDALKLSQGMFRMPLPATVSTTYNQRSTQQMFNLKTLTCVTKTCRRHDWCLGNSVQKCLL